MKAATGLVLVLLAAGLASADVPESHGGVASTIHNLSVSGPGDVKSLTETEVCRFCHVPHRPVVAEHLWSQPLSVARYETAEIRTPAGGRVPAPQPDGASRLCLSCHDGTVAISGVGGGAPRLSQARLGTDLSGSHPISFVVTDGALDPSGGSGMGLRPLASIQLDPHVKLDARGRMQCTTCHDPHDDSNHAPGRTPHFFVKPTIAGVCLVCHELD